jgi:hypothetical protein
MEHCDEDADPCENFLTSWRIREWQSIPVEQRPNSLPFLLATGVTFDQMHVFEEKVGKLDMDPLGNLRIVEHGSANQHAICWRTLPEIRDALGITKLEPCIIGGTTFRGRDGFGMEADDSLRSHNAPRSHDGQRWPTVVLEAACVQTLEQAQEKVRQWFVQSCGAVQVAIPVKVSRTSGARFDILVELYFGHTPNAAHRSWDIGNTADSIWGQTTGPVGHPHLGAQPGLETARLDIPSAAVFSGTQPPTGCPLTLGMDLHTLHQSFDFDA